MCRVVAPFFILLIGLAVFADELPHRESTAQPKAQDLDTILRASCRIFAGWCPRQ